LQSDEESGSSIEIDDDSEDVDMTDANTHGAGRQQQPRARPSRHGRAQPDVIDDDEDDEDF